MSTGFIFVKNWQKRQHHKYEHPPWHKVYNSVLRDDDYLRLSHADRGLLHDLWSLASLSGNGRVSADRTFLARQLNVRRVSLEPLIDAGFIEVLDTKLVREESGSVTPEKSDPTGQEVLSGEVEVLRPSLTQPSSSRARNEQWDGLVAVFGYSPSTTQEQSLWGKLVKELVAMDATEPWIIEASRRYDLDMPGVAKTPTALVKHAERLMNGSPKQPQLSAAGRTFELARQLREAGR